MKDSPQKFWRYLSANKPSIIAVLVNGNICSQLTDIAQAFNIFFGSVFTAQTTMHFAEEQAEDLSDSVVVSQEGALALLVNCDVKKSCGPDMIPNAFLKRY